MAHNPDKRAAAQALDLAALAREAGAVVRRLGPAGPLALLSVALPTIGLVTLAFAFNIVGPWLRSQQELGILLYALGFAVCSGLAIFPTHIQAALGGWAFGFGLGFPAALAGVFGASLIGYGIALRATGDRAVGLIAEKPKWQAVYRALLKSGFWRTLLIVWLIRLALSPFAMTNLVLAATRVSFVAYVVGTLFGLAPRTGAVVFLAVGVREVTAESGQNRWLWGFGIVLTLVAVLVIARVASTAVTQVTAHDAVAGRRAEQLRPQPACYQEPADV